MSTKRKIQKRTVTPKKDLIEQLSARVDYVMAQIEEIKNKQNSIAKFAAEEFGKLHAHQQTMGLEFWKAFQHVDMNIAALNEINREVFGQLTQIDFIIQGATVAESGQLNTELKDSAIEEVKSQARSWYADVVQSAFVRVRDQRLQEEAAKKAQAEAEAKKQADQTETQRIENELKAEPGVLTQVSGGPGSEIPEGATVFGG